MIRLLLVGLLGSACADQAEIAGTIHGTIRNQSSAAPGPVEVQIPWRAGGDDVPAVIGSASVVDSFPGSFSLDLWPPPKEAFESLQGPDLEDSDVRAAFAFIEVHPQGTVEPNVETRLSWAEKHMLVYAEEDIARGDTIHDVAIPKGYSLIELFAGDAEDQHLVSPLETPIEIRLVDDTDDLDWPN